MSVVNNKKEPIADQVAPLDNKAARIGRFVVGSIFGIVFMLFCFALLGAALKGPDTIQSGANSNGTSFGLIGNPTIGRLKVGDPAPDFVLEQLGGEPIQLSKLSGKIVFVNIWASWCKPCEAEMPAIQRFYQKYKTEDVVVLAVNYMESPETAKSFFKPRNLTIPVILDRKGEVAGKGFRITAVPESYFIDKSGRIGELTIGEVNFEQLEAKLRTIREQNP